MKEEEGIKEEAGMDLEGEGGVEEGKHRDQVVQHLPDGARVGWCYQSWGDNISVSPDCIRLPADNNR